MSFQLTDGAIETIMTGKQLEGPVLQVLGQKKIAGSGGQGADRYRLLLSDGRYSHSSAMLATQLNEKVINGELETYAVIRLNKYLCNEIQKDRWVIIVLEMDVVAQSTEVGQKLGNPQPFKQAQGGGGGSANPPPQPTPAAAPTPQTNGHVTGKVSPPPSRSAPAPMFNNAPGPAANKPPAQNKNFYGGTPGRKGPGANLAPGTPNTPGGTPSRVHPISSLTPYQNRWVIRARVTQKSAIKTWSNSRGEGKLFSLNLLDESGEIKATAFRDQVDKYYEMIEPNKVYYFSKAQLKTADKRYSTLENDYEMTFNNDTQVWLCDEDTSKLPTLKFNFVPINQLDKQEANSTTDVIGVVKSVGDLATVTTKANKEIKKRDVQLVDEGQVLIRMTLWGSEAENFAPQDNPVLAVRGCRVSDWNGRSLSALASSQVVIHPDIEEAHRLRGWYDSVGKTINYEEYKSEGGSSGSGHSTNWKTFAEVKGQELGHDKADYFTTKATVVFLRKENCMYMACPSENCNKKVVDQANGMYRCEKCNQEFPNYKWRMILSANLSDFTDTQWATCFQDTAEGLLGKSTADVGLLRETDEAAFDQLFQDANFKSYNFRMRAKMETYNDENRLKTVCVQATPINFVDYSKKLLTDIEKLMSVQ